MSTPVAAQPVDPCIRWDSTLIRKYDVAGPRYTSYPTAPQFRSDFGSAEYARHLRERDTSIEPLSLYVHIPFCRDICYYCACNKIVTRDAQASERYLLALEKEIALLAPQFDRRRRVTQLHWGGGTPTFLGNAELTRLMHSLASHFSLNDAPEREYSIEIDPRGVEVGTIALLKGLGFNRISMGIQDFDPDVQAAVNRTQSYAMVETLVRAVREHRFKSLNFDLIYGLPGQTVASMQQTLAQVMALAPDRISCYSYAHLPEVFKTQRSIDRLLVPSADAKLELLRTIINILTGAGYVYVGMDHFVQPDDELAKAFHAGSLARNFQGYSTQLAPELLGLGVSAISSSSHHHCQNTKSIVDYYASLDDDVLPVQRGLLLIDEDRLRRDIIMQLMCRMRLDITDIEQRFGIEFDRHFAGEKTALAELERDGLIRRTSDQITVTPAGRLLLRNVCMVFDAYWDPGQQRGSRTI